MTYEEVCARPSNVVWLRPRAWYELFRAVYRPPSLMAFAFGAKDEGFAIIEAGRFRLATPSGWKTVRVARWPRR